MFTSWTFNKVITVIKIILVLWFSFVFKKRIEDQHAINQKHLDKDVQEKIMVKRLFDEEREIQFLSGIMKAILTIVATKIGLKIVLAAFCSIYVVGGNKREAKRISKEIYGMDPDGDWMGRSEMHRVAEAGDVQRLEHLLNSGLLANCFAWDRSTPLHEASQGGHAHCAKLLIKFGATVNTAAVDGATPLSMAAAQGHEELVDLLIRNGGKVNPAAGIAERFRLERIKSPLVEAVVGGHPNCVNKLLECGGDANLQDFALGLPLSVAAKQGRAEIAKMLLLHGAEVSASVPTHRHALEADANKFMTPLHLAAKHEKPKLVELLLEMGADREAQNGEGKRPKDFAARHDVGEADLERRFAALPPPEAMTSEAMENEAAEILWELRQIYLRRNPTFFVHAPPFNMEWVDCYKVFERFESNPRTLSSSARLSLFKLMRGKNYVKVLRNSQRVPNGLKSYMMFE